MVDRKYKILLDGKWSLEDLSVFSRVYFQNYSFLYCLDTSAIGNASNQISSVLNTYELRHGPSYVNIYDIFRSHISKEERPQINSIQYASPGWIELALDPEVATQFAKVLAIYLSATVATATAYKKLYKIYSDLTKSRKKLQLSKLTLKAEEIKIVENLNIELAKGLGFNSLPELDKHTKDIEESSKLLMAHYRRVKKIGTFVTLGKASFPEK